MENFATTAGALVAKQTICCDERAVSDEIDALLAPASKPRIVSFVNAHAVLRSQKDSLFWQWLLDADRLYRDGSGMGMLMKRLWLEDGINMNGTDLIPKILDRCPTARRIALIGTRQERVDLVAHRLERAGHSSIVTADGFQPDAFYADLIDRERPGLIVLGMGMPKQERVAQLLADHPPLKTHDMVVINGGAIIDFMSGAVPRAPRWMRALGVEWLYRLLQEPWRMTPRLLDSITFTYCVCRNRGALKHQIESVMK